VEPRSWNKSIYRRKQGQCSPYMCVLCAVRGWHEHWMSLSHPSTETGTRVAFHAHSTWSSQWIKEIATTGFWRNAFIGIWNMSIPLGFRFGALQITSPNTNILWIQKILVLFWASLSSQGNPVQSAPSHASNVSEQLCSEGVSQNNGQLSGHGAVPRTNRASHPN
jgi:hypothetical protein